MPLRRIVSAFVLPLSLTACDAILALSGRVEDGTGGPIPRVVVTVSNGGCILTNSRGEFAMAWIDSPLTRHVTLTAKRGGFAAYRTRVPVNGTPIAIILEPDSTAIAPGDTLPPRKCRPATETD